MALLSVEQLERDSGVSRHTWRSWIRSGRIIAVRLGRRVRVEEEEYRRFIERCRTRPSAEVAR